MDKHLHRLVYCSRNRIQGSDAEIQAELESILASARKNNSVLEITGALLYNLGNFAQVLEGPLPAIERIFEVIQRDPRHSEVTVVYSGAAPARDFPEWSMAFIGSRDQQDVPLAAAAFHSVFSNEEGAGEQMLGALKDLVVSEDEWILSDAA